ncbi:MAG: transposase [Chlamydiales bacterium]|jgi:transposase
MQLSAMWWRLPGLRISFICVGIESYDGKIEELSRKEYCETGVLRRVHGVGPLIALAFGSIIGDPERFKKSRTIGAYLGLVPRIRQSGKTNSAPGITTCGDRYMRSLLVSAATRILAPSGPDSDLRRLVSASSATVAEERKLERELLLLENWASCCIGCFARAKCTSPCAIAQS